MTAEDRVVEKIESYLMGQFPQIAMHGGEADIVDLDLDEKHVTLQLSGACSGCGISPMTIQALKTRMPREIDEINHVEARTGEEVERPGITEGPF